MTVTITTTGVKDQKDISFLKYKNGKQELAFTGSALPTTLEVGFINANGVFVAKTGGAVTALPTTFVVNNIPPQGLALNVVGGTPDFDVDDGGVAKT